MSSYTSNETLLGQSQVTSGIVYRINGWLSECVGVWVIACPVDCTHNVSCQFQCYPIDKNKKKKRRRSLKTNKNDYLSPCEALIQNFSPVWNKFILQLFQQMYKSTMNFSHEDDVSVRCRLWRDCVEPGPGSDNSSTFHCNNVCFWQRFTVVLLILGASDIITALIII